MTETRLPPLPSAAVDFNVLHDALTKGEDPLVAAAMGVAAGRGEDWEPVSLKGKTVDQLRKIAAGEKVDVPEGADKTGIIAAIEGKRIADTLDGSVPSTAAGESDEVHDTSNGEASQ